MRNKIGFRLFLMAAMASATGIGAFVACGGSDTQDVISEDSGSEASLIDTYKPPVEDTGSNNQDTGTKDTGAADAKPVYDAGQPTTLDGGDGGIKCYIPGEGEEEPNDPVALAKELRPTRCGVVVVPDAGLADSDFLKFTLKDASTGFYLQYEGKITMTVRVKNPQTNNEETFVVSDTQSPTLPLYKGELYTVEVKSADGQTHNWIVTLFEQP